MPVVPAYVHGTGGALPKNSFMPRRRRVAVRFGPPLEPPAELLQKQHHQQQHQRQQQHHLQQQQQQPSGGLLAAAPLLPGASGAAPVAAPPPVGSARTPADTAATAVGARNETKENTKTEARKSVRRKAALDAFAERLQVAVLLLQAEAEAALQQSQQSQQQQQQSQQQEQQQRQAGAGAAARGLLAKPLREGRNMPRFAGDFLPRWLSGIVAALLAVAFSALRWLELAAWAAAAALRGDGTKSSKRRV